MNELLLVEKGLPPGLWLPLSEESTEQYKKESFNRPDHPYENIVDFGSFVVALAMFDEERICYMPNQLDLRALSKVGYGVSEANLRKNYGGLIRLQQSLGFYPPGTYPEKDALIERLKWMRSYQAYIPRIDGQHRMLKTNDVIVWGSSRRLLPSLKAIKNALGGTTELQKIFSIEKPHAREQLTPLDLYKFGARVIRDNSGPISQVKLDKKYSTYFLGSPSRTVRAFFNTLNEFWQEFGYICDASGMTHQDLVDVGVRLAITSGEPQIPKKRITELSAKKVFPSYYPIRRRFGNLSNYQKEIDEGYKKYQALNQALLSLGVAQSIINLACRKFASDNEFGEWLTGHSAELVKLSVDTVNGEYARKIIERGLDLGNDELLMLQQSDFELTLYRLGIKSKLEKQFALSLVPRLILTKY